VVGEAVEVEVQRVCDWEGVAVVLKTEEVEGQIQVMGAAAQVMLEVEEQNQRAFEMWEGALEVFFQ
jgi:hypothetical protein